MPQLHEEYIVQNIKAAKFEPRHVISNNVAFWQV